MPALFPHCTPRWLCPLIPGLALLFLGRCAGAQEPEAPPPAVVQEKVREWVRVKKQISAEGSDWEAEKQTLADLNELRKKEIAALDEIIASAGTRLTDAEEQRTGLLAEEESLRRDRRLLEEEIGKAETALRAMLPRFPPPLREKVDDAIARLQAASPDAPLQDRCRDLLTVLSEAESFHNTITIDAELRDIGGKKVEVDVLYLGLARAWYVDRTGRHAGAGIPAEGGWQWTEIPSAAASVRNAIAVRRKETAPAIVPLPFPAQTNAAGK